MDWKDLYISLPDKGWEYDFNSGINDLKMNEKKNDKNDNLIGHFVCRLSS